MFPLNPIDEALGAPAPEKRKTGAEDGPSLTPAYVFAVLYVVGRVLEDRLVRSRLTKRLAHG